MEANKYQGGEHSQTQQELFVFMVLVLDGILALALSTLVVVQCKLCPYSYECVYQVHRYTSNTCQMVYKDTSLKF